MADYWKSQARKYCNFCKCWIADNKPSIEYHENGKKHKENVTKRLKEIHKNSAKQAKQLVKYENEMEKMEKAAMAAYLKDIEGNSRDMMADTIIQNKKKQTENQQEEARNSNRKAAPAEGKSKPNESNYFQSYGASEIDPFDPYAKQKLARLASCKEKVESRRKEKEKNAEKSQGSSKSEKNKNSSKDKGNEIKRPRKKLWYEAKAHGHSYYWNIETNESVWEEPPEGFMSLAEQAEEAKEQEIQEQFLIEMDKETEKEREEALKERMANAEREKFRDIRTQLRVSQKVKNEDDANDVEEEAEERPYLRDYSVPEKPQPYGAWQVVHKTEEVFYDLQLPKIKAPSAPIIQFDETPAPKVFKEKTITHLANNDSDDEGPTLSFKKRKIGNRNARKRTTDD